MKTICIVDYGMGNLRSVQKAFEKVGFAAEISGDPSRVGEADRLVTSGFGAGAGRLVEASLRLGRAAGTAQVLARICELTFARNLNPLWTARFSLGLLDKAEGDINVATKTLSLGTPFQVLGATVAAKVDKQGLVHAFRGPGLGAVIDFGLIERKKVAVLS